jgi:photosystem II stability/assembly factor-like uncharacterized protein
MALIESSVNGGSTFTASAVPSNASFLVSVDCNDAVHCVAIGSDSVMESSNGGASWTMGALPPVPAFPPAPNGGTVEASFSFTGVACASESLCTAVGVENLSVTGAGGISSPNYIHSTDGGVTWTNSTPPADDQTMLSVTCSATLCLAAGEGSTRSTDGGATWSFQPNDLNEASDVACTAGDATCLELGPGSGPTTATAALSASTDGGQTWSPESSNMPSGSLSILAVTCDGASSCLADGYPLNGNGPLVVAVTGNSGTSWSLRTGPTGFIQPVYNIAIPFGPRPAAAATGPTSCLIVGSGASGAMASTTSDGGQTWLSSTVQ